ncbi:MAG: VanZ family protein [Phycisphaerales bacterium]
MTSNATKYLRRLTRPWRLVFVLYACALTGATHWPQLDIGTETQPAPDKLLHLFAFGGLALLLIQTSWLRTIWAVGVLTFMWTLLDELTQALPVLGRQSSVTDILAGELGVALVVTWAWALGSIGGVANRTRLAQQHFLLAELFRQPRTWIIVASAALLGALMTGGSIALVMKFVFTRYGGEQLSKILVAAMVGALAGTQVSLAGLLTRHAAQRVKQRPCFGCGSSCDDVSFDDFGRGRCSGCDAPLQLGQWVQPMQLPLTAVLRGGGHAVAFAGGLLIAGTALLLIVLRLSMHFGWAKSLVRMWNDLSPDMQTAVDLTAIAIIVACAVRMYRWRQAKLYDRQHEWCRACEHDLKGTPITQGVGVCPECGTPFVRFVK